MAALASDPQVSVGALMRRVALGSVVLVVVAVVSVGVVLSELSWLIYKAWHR